MQHSGRRHRTKEEEGKGGGEDEEQEISPSSPPPCRLPCLGPFFPGTANAQLLLRRCLDLLLPVLRKSHNMKKKDSDTRAAKIPLLLENDTVYIYKVCWLLTRLVGKYNKRQRFLYMYEHT